MEEEQADQDGKNVAEPVTMEKKLPILGNGQCLRRKNILIPVDTHCPLYNYSVYVESMSGMIYDAALNQSNTSNNHNKFYRLQVG